MPQLNTGAEILAQGHQKTHVGKSEAVKPYEALLREDARYALREGSLYFEESSAVQLALHKIATRLKEGGISYAVVGGLALSQHGYPRFTDDVDILVTEEGLRQIHATLDGLGYLPPFTGSKHLRDTELGVKIEFLVAGQFPGDGKPKPIAFPDPDQAGFETDGVRYIKLPQLVELKLASGMTSAGRLKDLADVQELIKILSLPKIYRDQLNTFVQGKFDELWDGIQNASGPESLSP